MKKILSILLALATVLSLSLPALASSYTDVSDGAWYADAVEYVTGHGLMDAAADGTFAPDESAPRSIVAEALWRVAGKPRSAKAAAFPDVGADDGNRDAIDWATEAGVINGSAPAQRTCKRAHPRRSGLRAAASAAAPPEILSRAG